MKPFSVNVESVKDTARCVVSDPSNKHQIVMDEPKAIGGTGDGLSPLQGALGAFFACEIAQTRLLLLTDPDLKELKIGAMRFRDATGYIDDRGYRSGQGPLPFQRVTAVCEVEGDVTQKQVTQLQEKVERQSPLYDMFVKSGCQMDVEWRKKE